MKFTGMPIIIIVLVCSLVLVTGCKNTKTETAVIPIAQEKTFGELYRFSAVNHFAYRLTTKLVDDDVTIPLASTVKPDALYGAPVWIRHQTE